MTIDLKTGCWGEEAAELEILFAGDLCPRGRGKAPIKAGRSEEMLAAIFPEVTTFRN